MICKTIFMNIVMLMTVFMRPEPAWNVYGDFDEDYNGGDEGTYYNDNFDVSLTLMRILVLVEDKFMIIFTTIRMMITIDVSWLQMMSVI